MGVTIVGMSVNEYEVDDLIHGRVVFFFSSRRRHTRLQGDWSSDVCSSDLDDLAVVHLDLEVLQAGGQLEDFKVEVNDGEVVLDVIHRLQATQTPDLAVRWNCKAGKCGSCSMEINGKPRLGCMTRMSVFEEDETVTVTPLRTFPGIRDP